MRGVSVVLTVAVVVAVGLTAGTLAQQGQGARDGSKILSGSDIGFRVERMEGNRAAGTLMVRIDGQWVEAVPAPKAMAVR